MDPPDEHKTQKTHKKKENLDFKKINDFYTFLELKKRRFPLQLKNNADKNRRACGGSRAALAKSQKTQHFLSM